MEKGKEGRFITYKKGGKGRILMEAHLPQWAFKNTLIFLKYYKNMIERTPLFVLPLAPITTFF